MSFVSERNIARVSFLYAIVVVAVMTFSTGALFIVRKVKTLDHDQDILEQEFIDRQKEQLRLDVTALTDSIDNRIGNLQSLYEKNLIDKVEEAKSIAESLYQSMQDKIAPEQMGLLIREAIRPIRFNDRHGYCFIFEQSGETILYPANPDLEGSNLKYTMLNSSQVVENLIAIATAHGKGMYSYDWYKPNYESDILYPKLTYVTLFDKLGWIIGSGEYLDDLDDIAKRTITLELRRDLTTENPDYYFIYDLHNIDGGKDFATILVNNNRTDLEGKKISDDIPDSTGKLFRKEFLRGIRKNGEAFVVYTYKKPDGGTGRKLSFFKLYPRWNWIVARGVYFDRLDQMITNQKTELQKKVRDDIALLILFFLAAVTIALIVAYHFSHQLQAIFNRYQSRQEDDLTKLEELNRTLAEQNRIDALTGIYNRGYFNTKLEAEISKSRRYGNPLSVILLDIDHFKAVNDTFGHLAGDTVLRDFAELVQCNIRKTDTFARWGGEEFIVLAPGIGREQAAIVAEKLRQLIADHTFSIKRPLTASFGISAYRQDEERENMLQRADKALYRAKMNGRNRTEWL